MSHLRSINPAIVALLLLAAGLGFIALSLARGGKPQTHSLGTAKAQPVAASSPDHNSEQPVGLINPASSSSEFLGVTIAREAIEVAAPSEGRLEAVYVNLGDQLKLGGRIARLNSDSISQQLTMAQASLLAAEADERRTQLALAEAEGRSSRRQTLAAEGLLSREEVVTAELQVKMAVTNLDAAKARIAEQQARVAQIKDSLNNAELRAPFAGTVAARLANPGTTVHPGAPIISLIREDDLWIRFAAPPERLASFSIGSVINIKIEAFSSGTSGTTAVILHVAPAADPVSQLIFVEARLRIPAAWHGRIKPGLIAKCSVVR